MIKVEWFQCSVIIASSDVVTSCSLLLHHVICCYVIKYVVASRRMHVVAPFSMLLRKVECF